MASFVAHLSQVLCQQLREEHEAATAAAQADHAAAIASVAARNKAAEAAAQAAFAAAAEKQAEQWAALLAAMQREHDIQRAAVSEHNERVWPQVRQQR